MVLAPRIAGAMARLAAQRAGRNTGYGVRGFNLLDEGEHGQALDSSAIARAGYSEDDRTLTITFLRSGKTYTYYSVPFTMYEMLVNSTSPGRFFNANIRNRYSYS